MKKALVIKTRALGEVLRSTVILHFLEDYEVTWVAKKNAFPLLEDNPKINRLVDIEKALGELVNEKFDLTLSFDDERECCELGSVIKSKRLIGAYINSEGSLDYTPDSAKWFDMSLISKQGKAKADELKKDNEKTHQEIFVEMLGYKFNGEEYILGVEPKEVKDKIVGLIDDEGSIFKMKKWGKYNELRKALVSEGWKIKELPYRESLKDHIDDINDVSLLVCADSLPMHLGLALGKNVIALFGCTSAKEIYDYGRLTKIVAPMDCVCCYKKECDIKPNCMDKISVDDVMKRIA